MYERTKIRKYKRMETPYMARFRVKQYEDQEMSFPDWDIVAVENLSAGGMLFNYSKNLERDLLLDFKIDISKSIPTINCIGKIIRIEEFQYLLTQDVQPLNSMFRIATEFTEIDKQERDMINITAEETLRKEAKGKNFDLEKPRPRAVVLEDDYLLRTLIDDALKDRG